jgi:hypothetical protein
MDLIDKILCRKEFEIDPPILLDIGSSGHLHNDWKRFAKYSICIAFDADNREMGYIEKKSGDFKKLYVYNCIVSDRKSDNASFYLTQSPFCSSLLPPDNVRLKDWSFTDLFNVEKIENIKVKDLTGVFNELDIKRIDWFKTDSQGTDLRLFKSIGGKIMDKVLAVDFEPGIIDAYKGEDKLWNVLKFMDDNLFWVSDLNIPKAAVRIDREILIQKINPDRLKYFNDAVTRSPTCGEITYFNSFKNNDFEIRDYLLMIVFSLIKNQEGFVLELCFNAKQKYDDDIFDEIEKYVLNKINSKIKNIITKESLIYKIFIFPLKCTKFFIKKIFK